MARKLTKREKYSIYAVSGIICLFVVFQFIVFPTVDKREHQERALQVKTKMLEEMVALKSEYDAIKKNTDLSNVQFARREKGTYMKPSTSVRKNSPYKISKVEMKLKGLTLQQLTSYLHMVETSKNIVRIKKLSISKTGKQEDFIDAVLQVETSEI